jgi:hypothetical protein
VADPATRSAARLAAAVALPAALVAGLIAYRVFSASGAHPRAVASPSPQSSAPVAMSAPWLAERPAKVCAALLSRLPAALRDRPRRPVTAGPKQNVAYGDPAITLACGAPPVIRDPRTVEWTLSGVCWYADEVPGATAWTTLDREVPVQVRVPNAYSPPGQWVIEFSAAIDAAVPPVPDPPSGCKLDPSAGP